MTVFGVVFQDDSDLTPDLPVVSEIRYMLGA